MKLRKQLLESIQQNDQQSKALTELYKWLCHNEDSPLLHCPIRLMNMWHVDFPPILIDITGDKPRAAYCTQIQPYSGDDTYFSSVVSAMRLDYCNAKGDLKSYWVSDLNMPRREVFMLANRDAAEACLSEQEKQEIAKLRFVDYDRYRMDHSHSRALYSDFMTVPKAVNALRQSLGLEPATPQANNRMLQQIEKIVKNCRPVALIPSDRAISDIYFSEPDDCFGSCMAGNHESYFRMYDDLQRMDRLKMLLVYPNQETADGAGDYDCAHIGRALLWCDAEGTPKWIDRVYAHNVAGSLDRGTLEVVEQWCLSNDITKTVNVIKNPYLTERGFGGATIRIPAPSDHPDDYHKVPYVDSLSYWCADGYLRNTEDAATVIAEFDQTDGSYSGGPERVEDYRGDMILADDAVDYYDGGYIDVNVAAELSPHHYGSGEHACDYEVTRDWRGDYIVDEHRNQCLDGEWAHNDDVTELYDGTYAHPGMDITTLHDGSIAADDYHDIVQLHDGDYALKSDCTQASNGEWVLTDDLAQYEADNAPEIESELEEQTA